MLIAAGALVYWTLSLFNQMDEVTAQRVLRRPAEYYSDISVLRTGQAMSVGRLGARLKGRGYKQVKETELSEGQFSMQGDFELNVFFRHFDSPDGRAVSGAYIFAFGNGKITRITRMPEGVNWKEIVLEPMRLGDLHSGGLEHSPWVRLEKVPDILKTAILDSEDRRFYSHSGIDVLGILRAVWVNTINSGVRQGGSTITQQLVRNAFLTQKRTLSRKLTEAMLALLIETRYGKEQIFELYLNQIYLGQSGLHVIYGVEDASLSYFGKHVSALNLPECAMLAGIIPSPGRYNPRLNFKQALERRNHTLDLLVKNGRITQEDERISEREFIVLAPVSSQNIGSYYIDWVRQLMEQQYGNNVLESQGYKIYTALDPELEIAAEKTISTRKLEGAIVAMDQYTGYVRALVGGRDFGKEPFNRAVLAKRSPGSAFKPIIYAAGLEYNIFKPDSMLEDKPIKITVHNQAWEPKNYDGKYLGAVTYKDALVFSRNIPAIEVLEKIGAGRVADFAATMGIQSKMTIVPSLALGTSEVTPLEMTAAYAPLANGGFAVKPIFVLWITDNKGRAVAENKPEIKRAITQKTASQVTEMLEEVIGRGTGRNARLLGLTGPAAGKTGTSDYFKDAWFIGYNPEILCGVWMGNDQPSSLGKAAAEIALPVWVDFMKNVTEKNPSARMGKPLMPGGVRGFFIKLFGL